MAEKTAIAWCDHTFNPWIGCTEVSVAKSGGGGCDNCYARELDKRHKWGGATHWGAGVPRHRTSAANWAEPIKWDKKAKAAGEVRRVFCASLADVFDNEVDPRWRLDLFDLIRATPNLSWLLVTKRIGNVYRMVPWHVDQFPSNIRLLITVCNQGEADRDIPKLLALPCKNGISYEPALGPVDWSHWMGSPFYRRPLHCDGDRTLEWIIVGGESTQGAKARTFPIQWAYNTIGQCKAAGVPVFVKQLGSNVIERNDAGFEGDGDDQWPAGTADKIEHNPFGYLEEHQGAPVRVHLKHRAGADPAEWPEDLRVREFPA